MSFLSLVALLWPWCAAVAILVGWVCGLTWLEWRLAVRVGPDTAAKCAAPVAGLLFVATLLLLLYWLGVRVALP